MLSLSDNTVYKRYRDMHRIKQFYFMYDKMNNIQILTLIVVYNENFTKCANILGVFPFPSYSHQITYQPVWRELALREHKVTVVTPDLLNDPSLINLTEISARYLYDVWQKLPLEDILSKDKSVFSNLNLLYRWGDVVLEEMFTNKHFQELIRDENKTFDLVLLEFFSPGIYAIPERFQAPVIFICPVGGATIIYDVLGNPNHPVLYPDSFLSFDNQRMSLWKKTVSLLYSVWSRYYHYYDATPRSHELNKQFFGENIPYLGDIEKNISMIFTNVIPSIYPQRPHSSTNKDLHHLHFKPREPLPQNLQQILDDAKEGVVYFSLGTNVKSAQLEDKLKNIIIEALSELPYTVIWKYESNDLPNKPANVRIQKWLPQQDLLAHPNIRAFVTQGGILSIGESIFNTVPLVGLPFIGDQPMNIKKIVDLGIGVSLDPVTVTKDKLKNSIIDVAENETYKRRIKEVCKRTFDRQIKSVEEAVWWIEYVIRHKGAKHLRSPNADISWFQFLLLDVIFVFIMTITLITIVTNRIYSLAKFKIKFWNNKI